MFVIKTALFNKNMTCRRFMNSDFFEGWAKSPFGLFAALTEQGKICNNFYKSLVPRRHGRSHIKENYIGNRYVGRENTYYEATIRKEFFFNSLYYDLTHYVMLWALGRAAE